MKLIDRQNIGKVVIEPYMSKKSEKVKKVTRIDENSFFYNWLKILWIFLLIIRVNVDHQAKFVRKETPVQHRDRTTMKMKRKIQKKLNPILYLLPKFMTPLTIIY